MGYTFSNNRFYFGKKQELIQKDAAVNATLRKLRAYLDATEPDLVYFLVNMWRHQGQAITYKELREAILAGDISIEFLEDWQQDYSRFVVSRMQSAWESAIEAAAKEIADRYPEWSFDPMGDGVSLWTKNHAAEFVTNCTSTQIEGLRAVVRKAAVLEDMGVDALARAIRPMVGLTQPQAVANLSYYTKLIEKGVSEKRARELSMLYGARQHRYRGYNIARTELALAYNQGSYEGTKQAQAAGYMGQVVKVWCTADDERVCHICGPLDGKAVAMDEDFDFKTKLTSPTIRKVPPAHPSCRCSVLFKEIAPPAKK